MKICQRNGPLDAKVHGKGGEGGALGTTVEILLEYMEVPATARYVLKKIGAWGSPCRHRCLARAAAHGGEHLLIQGYCEE